jgi:hypothetical protein
VRIDAGVSTSTSIPHGRARICEYPSGAQRNVPLHCKCLPVQGDHRAIGERVELGSVAALGLPIEPFGVKDLVHRRSRCAPLLASEQKRKPLGILAPAFEARPVARGEGRHFIEKKQLGIAVAPDLPVAVVERELATDPGAVDPTARAQFPLCVMQPPAPVSHQRPACRRRKQFAER